MICRKYIKLLTFIPVYSAYYPKLIDWFKKIKATIMSWLNAGINSGVPSRGSYDDDNFDDEDLTERQVSATLFLYGMVCLLTPYCIIMID